MVDGRVTDDIIENHVHATLVDLLKQLPCILVRAITGSYLVVVADIIARIIEGRIKKGIKPDGIYAKTLHVVQFADDALDVADTVAVGIAERLRIDLVKHGILRPFRHLGHFITARDGLRMGCQCQHGCAEQKESFDIHGHVLLV